MCRSCAKCFYLGFHIASSPKHYELGATLILILQMKKLSGINDGARYHSKYCACYIIECL